MTLGSSHSTSSALLASGQRVSLASIPVTGISMWPTLRHGDLAGFSSAEDLALGDVVVLRQRGALVVHRVVGFPSAEEVQTRGDNCEHLDAPAPRSSIIGRVNRVERAGRTLERNVWDVGPSFFFRQYLRLRRALRMGSGRTGPSEATW